MSRREDQKSSHQAKNDINCRSDNMIDMSKPLKHMAVDDVIECLYSIDGMQENFIPIYGQIMKEKNITGRVLQLAELNELKFELNMAFGDWLLFKNWLLLQEGNSGKYATDEILHNHQLDLISDDVVQEKNLAVACHGKTGEVVETGGFLSDEQYPVISSDVDESRCLLDQDEQGIFLHV